MSKSKMNPEAIRRDELIEAQRKGARWALADKGDKRQIVDIRFAIKYPQLCR